MKKKKFQSKFISIGIMALIMIVLFNSLPLTADAISQDNVISKINTLNGLFPSGSYFTASKGPCDSQYLKNFNGYMLCYSSTCPNCELGKVLQQNTTAGNAVSSSIFTDKGRNSCCAFAAFAFGYIFGHDPNVNTYQIASDDYGGINEAFLSQLRPGDYLTFNNGKHYAIFLGYDSSNIYLYHSNSTGAGKVQYNGRRAWSYYNKIVAKRSKTYDVPVTQEPTPTIKHGYTGSTNEITETNAVLYGTVSKPTSYKTEAFGIRLWRSTASSDKGWTYIHAASKDWTGTANVKIWFNVQDEVEITLTHATSYTYQLYAKINGVEYWSSEATFTTAGSHSYGSWQTTKKATCTTDGTQKRTCQCGASESKNIDATGHSFSAWKTTTAATCTVAGTQTRTCSCGAAESKSIDATSHSFGAWTVTKEPTYTETGTETRKCTSCQLTETKLIAKLALDGHTHNYSDWVLTSEANCIQAGQESHTCTICFESEVRGISPLGHNYGEWFTQTKPTTENEGVEIRVCLRCEKTESHTIAKLPEAETIIPPSDAAAPQTEPPTASNATPVPDAEGTEVNSNNPQQTEDTPKTNYETLVVILLAVSGALCIAVVSLIIILVKKK